MSRSLSLRLDSLERTFGNIPIPMSPEECDEFMGRVFELAGGEIDPRSRERLMAEFRDVQKRGESIRFVPPADQSKIKTARLQHDARILESGSRELLSLLADACDRHAAGVA